LAEREVWKVTDSDPNLHVTTRKRGTFALILEDVRLTKLPVNLSFFMGPFAPGFILQPGAVGNLSTNLMIYNIMFADSKSPTPLPGYIDVRGVAAALVAAIRQATRADQRRMVPTRRGG